MSETKKSNVVGIVVTVIMLLAVALATGVVMYQHRGKVVFVGDIQNRPKNIGPKIIF